MNTLITNSQIITQETPNRVLTGQAVAIEGAWIKAVGPEADLRQQFADYEVLDGRGRVLMPGLINAHNHFYGLYARGLALNRRMENFREILQYLWWALDKTLDEEAVYYSAILPAISSVKHGVTTVIDHHASPNAVDGSLDQIERAMRQVGLRGILCYEVSDRDGKAIREAGLRENERFMQKCRSARETDPTTLYDGLMGLHASFTVDEETLESAAAICQNLERGVHVHVQEDWVDNDLSEERYGHGPLARLFKHNLLGEKSICAHVIHSDDVDLRLLEHTNTNVTHQPQSNMNNAVGRADIFKMLGKGILLGVGTDGMTPDIKAETRTGYLLHKHVLRDSNVGWNEWQNILLQNNPAIVRRITGQKVGQIITGFLADLILVDYFPPTPLTGDNVWGHFLYGLVDTPVDTVMINGNVVMRDKVVLGVDEAEIAAASRTCAEKVWQRFHQ